MMNMTDEEIAAEAVAKLRSIFTTQAVPNPTKFIVYNWLKDEFSKSAYSYNIVDGMSARIALFLSLPNYKDDDMDKWRVHFAGEATSKLYYGLLQGAVKEGRKAAKNVKKALDYIKKKDEETPDDNVTETPDDNVTETPDDNVTETPNDNVTETPTETPDDEEESLNGLLGALTSLVTSITELIQSFVNFLEDVGVL